MLKGDQGDRVGGYVWVNEFESVEARNRCFPPPGGQGPEEWQRCVRANKASMDKWRSLLQRLGTYAEYVMLES